MDKIPIAIRKYCVAKDLLQLLKEVDTQQTRLIEITEILQYFKLFTNATIRPGFISFIFIVLESLQERYYDVWIVVLFSSSCFSSGSAVFETNGHDQETNSLSEVNK